MREIDVEGRPDFWVIIAPAEEPDRFVSNVTAHLSREARKKTAADWPHERYRVPILRTIGPDNSALYKQALDIALRTAATNTGSAVLLDSAAGTIAVGPHMHHKAVRLVQLLLN